MSTDQYLSGVHAVFVEQGIGEVRTKTLGKRLRTRGGSVLPGLSDAATHILVGNDVRRNRLPALLKVANIPSDVHVIRADWLSTCFVRGEHVGEEEFSVPLETVSAKDREKGRLPKGDKEEGEGEGTSGVSEGSPVKAVGVLKLAAEKDGQGEVEAGEETSTRRWIDCTNPRKKRPPPDSDTESESYIDSSEEEKERTGPHFVVPPYLIMESKTMTTDDLTVHYYDRGKYEHLFRLPAEQKKRRRIDIFVTPYSELIATLVL